jgi:outer membrane protein OmpA-like peptidoglycan-associated protein
MNTNFGWQTGRLLFAAAIALPAMGSLAAQELEAADEEVLTTVYGSVPTEGPEIEGVIVARDDDRIQVRAENGTSTIVAINDETQIRGTGGFLGSNNTTLRADALLNGLPVTVDTLQYENRLIASRIKFRNKDLKTAQMIQSGTAQRFAQQDALIDENATGIDENTTAIGENAAATEALRGRLGDIDKYNIKGTTNVYFRSGQYQLSPQAREELCQAAAEADAMESALLLVVGYTDSTGSYEVNQRLSERRAGRVVNHLQQSCGWKPWRMLAPTGMATADPLADNSTAAGRAQNRRVSVNILVSKSLDEQ